MTPIERHEHDALARLSRVNGPMELRAAALALLAQPSTDAAIAVWQVETESAHNAESLLADTRHLSDAVRLPALEVMLSRLRLQPKPERRLLLLSARRLMATHAPLRPIDRLHWLVMRRKLGDRPPAAASPESNNDLAKLPAASLLQVARVTAYL